MMAHSLDELARGMLELPSDWWQKAATVKIVVQGFKRHILPLFVAGTVQQDYQYSVYTGILLKHENNIVWLTAGHVVDELIQILNSPSFKPSQISWLDNFKLPGAESVSLHRRDIPMKSWRNSGLDLGAVLPSILDIGNILKNDNVKTINSVIWKNLSEAQPEGYYAIGYPRPWSQYSRKKLPNNKVLHQVIADIACLPLLPVSPPSDVVNDPQWSDPEAFYGNILPYPDEPTLEVEDVKGMSGGPVLSVERDPDGMIRYRLVGIIQSWRSSLSIIRAEPIHRIAHAIDCWLKEDIPSSY